MEVHRVSFLNRNSSGNGAQIESEAHPACGSREREGFRGVGSELSERAREWESGRGKIAFSADSTSCIMRSKQQRRERGGRDRGWDAMEIHLLALTAHLHGRCGLKHLCVTDFRLFIANLMKYGWRRQVVALRASALAALAGRTGAW